MKNILSIVLTCFIGVSTLLGQNKVDQYRIQVDGLGCPFCAYGLEKKFKEFKGIKKVDIKIETGDFSFQYPSENPLSMEQILNQVEKAGYTPKKAEIIRVGGETEVFPNKITTSSKLALNKAEIHVSGNCDMCKARIEAAALSNTAVQFSQWDKISKKLVLKFDETISIETIGQLVANAGHDNEYAISETKVYDQLPPCCLYRK